MIGPVTGTGDFDSAALQAWLDDPEGVTVIHDPSPPAYGYVSMLAAIVEAESHSTCGPDGRTYRIYLGLTGKDRVPTVQVLEPGLNVNCVLGALKRDPDLAIEILGAELVAPEATKPEPEEA